VTNATRGHAGETVAASAVSCSCVSCSNAAVSFALFDFLERLDGGVPARPVRGGGEHVAKFFQTQAVFWARTTRCPEINFSSMLGGLSDWVPRRYGFGGVGSPVARLIQFHKSALPWRDESCLSRINSRSARNVTITSERAGDAFNNSENRNAPLFREDGAGGSIFSRRPFVLEDCPQVVGLVSV